MTLAKFHVRPAVSTDFVAIVALERATDRAPHWPPSTYADLFDVRATAPQRCLFVAEREGELAGFAVGLLHPSGEAALPNADRIAELESVVVAAHTRRIGIGRALCNAVLDWSRSRSATEVMLEVRSASAGAIALYACLGFIQTGRRPRYYRDPVDDALVMRLLLKRRRQLDPRLADTPHQADASY